MTKDDCAQVLALLAEVYDCELSMLKIEAYYEVLKDYEESDVKESVMTILKTRKYSSMPMPAEIIENISGKIEDRALLAWSIARQTIINVGIYRTVSFEDKIINGTIQAMGGWEKFANMKIEEEPYRQRDFIAMYQAVGRSGRECPHALPGIFEITNGIRDQKEMKHIECSYLRKENRMIEKKISTEPENSTMEKSAGVGNERTF